MGGVAKDRQTPGRINMRPSPQVFAFLEELATLGVHGKSPTEVAEYLIQQEIEGMINDEYFLKARKASKRTRS